MHRFRIALTVAARVLVLAVAAAVAWSSPATAGGPTSVLLSVPGEATTTSLYYTDPQYDALAGLVGVENTAGVWGVDSTGQSHENGPGVTVTWLIHDVEPWRVDRIYLEGEGAPWIATQILNGGGGTIWDSPVVWHQPQPTVKLVQLLEDLGVADAARDAGSFSGVAGAPVEPAAEGAAAGEPAAQEPAAQEPAARESSVPEPAVGMPGLTSLGWGLGGLVLGAVVAGAWRRRRTTDTSAAALEPGPEPELEHDQRPAPGPGRAEELAWPETRV